MQECRYQFDKKKMELNEINYLTDTCGRRVKDDNRFFYFEKKFVCYGDRQRFEDIVEMEAKEIANYSENRQPGLIAELKINCTATENRFGV